MKPLSIFEPPAPVSYLHPPGNIFSDEDAAVIGRGLKTLPPHEREFAQWKLREYRQFRAAYPRPLSQAERDAYQQRQRTVEGFYEDFDKAAVGRKLPALGLMSEGPEKEAQKRRLANSAFLRHLTGQDFEGPDRQGYLDSFADKLFDGAGKGSEDNFHTAAKGWFDGIKGERTILQGGADQASKKASLFRIAQRDALAGVPWTEGFSKWQAEQGGRAEWKTGIKHLAQRDLVSLYREAWQVTDAKVSPYRPEIRKAFESLKEQYDTEGQGGGSPREAAKALWAMPMDEFRRIALPAIAAYGELHPAEAKGFFQQLDETATRMGGRFGRGTMRSIQATGDDFFTATEWITGGAGGDFTFTKQAAKHDEMNAKRELLARLAEGTLDPIEPVSESGFWQGAENMAYDTMGSIVQMATAALPLGLGIPGSIEAYRNDSIANMMMEHKEMSLESATLIGSVSAPAQWALDKLSLAGVAGKMPGTRQLLERIAKPGASWEKMLGYGLGATATEYGAEKLQDASPLLAQEILSNFVADIPRANWEGFELLDARTLLAVLPLVAVGTGMATARDAKASRDMISDPTLLAVVGFSPAQITKITSPQTVTGQVKALREEWGNRNMTAKGATANPAAGAAEVAERGTAAQAAAMWEQRMREASEAYAELTAANVRLSRVIAADGSAQWRVTTAEGHQILHDDPQEAVATMRQAMESAKIAKEDTFFEGMSAYAETLNPDDAINITNESGNLLDQALSAQKAGEDANTDEARAKASADIDAIVERANVYRRGAGRADIGSDLSSEETRAGLKELRVYGKTETQFREGIARSVMTIYDGGTVADMVEERIEQDGKAFVGPKKENLPALAAGLRHMEQLTGDKYLHGEETNSVAVIEGLSDMMTVLATGARTDGSRVSKALRTQKANEVRAARNRLRKAMAEPDSTGVAEQMREYLQEFKAVMARAARLEKARREGNAPAEVMDLVYQSVGLGGEREHLAAVRTALAEQEAESQSAAPAATPAAPGEESRAPEPVAMSAAMARRGARSKPAREAAPESAVDGEEDLGATFSVRAISEKWDARGIKNAISENDTTITLSRVEVPQDRRGQGEGTKAMEELTAYADAEGKAIALSPSVDFGGSSVSRLREFYKRFGFVENKGRKRDLSVRETMIRPVKISDRVGLIPGENSTTIQSADGRTLTGPATFSIRAFHGTPHKVDKFSTDKIGTGEGFQAFGWGLYSAESRELGEEYANTLGGPKGLNTNSWKLGKKAIAQAMEEKYSGQWILVRAKEILEERAAKIDRAYPRDVREHEQAANHIREIYKGAGNVYTVELLVEETDLLDWDGQLTEKQKALLRADPLFAEYGFGTIGWHFYKELAGPVGEQLGGGTPEKASKRLAALGIPGIKYLDGASRAGGEGTRNFVIFEDRHIRITEENGNSVTIADAALATFAVRPADSVEEMARRLAAQAANPDERLAAMTKAKEALEGMARAMRWNDSVAGPMSEWAISQDRIAMRKRLLAEKMEAVESDFGDLSGAEFLAQAYSAPVVEALFGDPIKGTPFRRPRLQRPPVVDTPGTLTGLSRGGEWDGADGIPRHFFGGTLSPDNAAQELFESGLIRSPDPDDMWRALASALRTRTNAQARLDAYARRKREAREEAADESSRWAMEQLTSLPVRSAEQSRADLVKAVSALDLLLMPFPPEVRAKVGGFVPLVAKQTNQSRGNELLRRVDRLGRVFEEHLRKEYADRITTLLEKGQAKREAGNKPGGKLGAEGHTLFDKAKAAAALTSAETDEQIAKLTAAIDGLDANDKKGSAELGETLQVVTLFGGLRDKTRTARSLAEAHAWLQENYDRARTKWRMREEARLGEVQRLAGVGVANFGGPKLASDRINTKEALGKFGAGSTSFNGAMRAIFGAESELTKRWTRAARVAINGRADEFRALRDGFVALKNRTYGKGWKGDRALHDELVVVAEKTGVKITDGMRKIRVELDVNTAENILAGRAPELEKEFTAAEKAELRAALDANVALDRPKDTVTLIRIGGPAAGTDLQLSQGEAMHYSLMWAQPQGKIPMQAHGFTEETMEEIETFLAPRAKELRAWMAMNYTAEWGPLNQVFARMYGVNLPRIENYSPLKFWSQSKQGQANPNPLGGPLMPQGGMSTGMLKERLEKHEAEPRKLNAVDVFFDHMRQTAHFKAFAELTREMRGVMGNKEVERALFVKFGQTGKDLMEKWMTALEQGGLTQKPGWYDETVEAMGGARAVAVLAWNFKSALTNSLNLLGAARGRGITASDYVRGLVKLFSGRLNWVDTFRNSEIIRRRIDSGTSPEVQAAMGRIAGMKPGRLKAFVEAGMHLHAYSDAIFTAGSVAIAHDAYLTQFRAEGLAEADAQKMAMEATEQTVADTAQPTEFLDKSTMEMERTALERTIFAFLSDPRQKMALILEAHREKDWKRLAKLVVIDHAVAGIIMQTIANAWRDMNEDDDGDVLFDPLHWKVSDYLAAMAMGPWAALPVIGPVMEAVVGAAQGTPSRDSSLFGSVGGVAGGTIRSLKAAVESDEPVEDYVALSRGLGAAAATLSGDPRYGVVPRVGSMAFDLVDNLVESPDEQIIHELKVRRLREKEENPKPEKTEAEREVSGQKGKIRQQRELQKLRAMQKLRHEQGD